MSFRDSIDEAWERYKNPYPYKGKIPLTKAIMEKAYAEAISGSWGDNMDNNFDHNNEDWKNIAGLKDKLQDKTFRIKSMHGEIPDWEYNIDSFYETQSIYDTIDFMFLNINGLKSDYLYYLGTCQPGEVEWLYEFYATVVDESLEITKLCMRINPRTGEIAPTDAQNEIRKRLRK